MSAPVKIGVIIPTRGDRPGFQQNYVRMLNAQTLQPTIVLEVDYAPRSQNKDITQRYRFGYDWFRAMGMDLLCFWEDDDWYSPTYLEVMAMEWIIAGRPSLFGINYTWYYHMQIRAYFEMKHLQRASAMATFIRPDLEFKWCADDQPYTDAFLWMESDLRDKKLIHPEQIICMGMKHGVGMSGGQHHLDCGLDRYVNPDPDGEFLKNTVDKDSFSFYHNYFEK